MARLGKDKRFIVSTKGNEGNARTNTIEFNFRRKELSDIRVRRAIAHAINVPFFIDNFLGDFAKLGTGPIPSTSTDFYPGAEHAAISLRQGQGRGAAGRSRLQAGHRRHTLLAKAAARAVGRGHLAVVDLHPAVAAARSASPSRSCATTAAASSSRSMTSTPSISPPAGTSTATIPRSRPRSGIAPASPRARPGPTSGAGRTRPSTRPSTMPLTEVDPAKRKALYAEFVKEVNTGAAGLDADRADFRHRDHGEGAQPLQYAALGLDELARSLAFRLTPYPSR